MQRSHKLWIPPLLSLVAAVLMALPLTGCFVVAPSMSPVRESQVYRHGQLLFTTAPIATPRELTPKDRNTLANELTAIAARLAAAPSLHETFAKAVKIERRAGQPPLRIVAEQQPSKTVPGTVQFDIGILRTIYVNAFGDSATIGQYFSAVTSYHTHVVSMFSLLGDDDPIETGMNISERTESLDADYRKALTFAVSRLEFDYEFLCHSPDCMQIRDAYALIATRTLLPGTTIKGPPDAPLDKDDELLLLSNVDRATRTNMLNAASWSVTMNRLRAIITGPLQSFLQ